MYHVPDNWMRTTYRFERCVRRVLVGERWHGDDESDRLLNRLAVVDSNDPQARATVAETWIVERCPALAGCVVEAMGFDFDRGALSFLVSHSSFGPVAACEMVPEMVFDAKAQTWRDREPLL